MNKLTEAPAFNWMKVGTDHAQILSRCRCYPTGLNIGNVNSSFFFSNVTSTACSH